LQPLGEEELQQLLIGLSPKYQEQMLEEIASQTLIEDPEHTMKVPEMTDKIKEELKTQYQVHETFF